MLLRQAEQGAGGRWHDEPSLNAAPTDQLSANHPPPAKPSARRPRHPPSPVRLTSITSRHRAAAASAVAGRCGSARPALLMSTWMTSEPAGREGGEGGGGWRCGRPHERHVQASGSCKSSSANAAAKQALSALLLTKVLFDGSRHKAHLLGRRNVEHDVSVGGAQRLACSAATRAEHGRAACDRSGTQAGRQHSGIRLKHRAALTRRLCRVVLQPQLVDSEHPEAGPHKSPRHGSPDAVRPCGACRAAGRPTEGARLCRRASGKTAAPRWRRGAQELLRQQGGTPCPLPRAPVTTAVLGITGAAAEAILVCVERVASRRNATAVPLR